MPSPFPGMNPYLEQPDRWRDVHLSLLQAVRAALTPLVEPRYFVALEESLYIDPGDGPELFAVADAAVRRSRVGRQTGGGAAVVAAPVTATVELPRQRRARRMAIRDTQSREVVTVIELLSPSNKQPGADRDRYLDKRAEVMASAASLVEIDLLRGGRRMPADAVPACDYLVMVGRAAERPRVGLWPVGLREPLPAIPVPLRRGEPEPAVDLKRVLDKAYDEAGYASEIYHGRPDPPLSAADAEWARQFVPAGRRG